MVWGVSPALEGLPDGSGGRCIFRAEPPPALQRQLDLKMSSIGWVQRQRHGCVSNPPRALLAAAEQMVSTL